MKMPMPMPQPSNHGFSLLGRSSLVLSHIPMFMPPHQAQLFLEIKLSRDDGQDPTKIYLDDQAKTKTTDYVLLADPLVLPKLGPEAADPIHSFTGKLFRGWPFNNPNTAPLLVPKLTVHILRSLYFHDITHDKPAADLTYLAFRTPETGYLVHKLVQPADLKKAPVPPDFVQILSAEIGELGSAKRPHVEELSFPSVPNNLAHKLAAGQAATGMLHGKKAKIRTHAELIYDSAHLT